MHLLCWSIWRPNSHVSGGRLEVTGGKIGSIIGVTSTGLLESVKWQVFEFSIIMHSCVNMKRGLHGMKNNWIVMLKFIPLFFNLCTLVKKNCGKIIFLFKLLGYYKYYITIWISMQIDFIYIAQVILRFYLILKIHVMFLFKTNCNDYSLKH